MRRLDGPTGILMLNMASPASPEAVGPFLRAVFADRDIMRLPAQRVTGPLLAALRAPKVRRVYESIGGGSPLLALTEAQGRGMVQRLDAISPETAPHRHYVALRYTDPSSDDALRRLRLDGARRVVAFSQYPQYSSTTTGSSLKDLWRAAGRARLDPSRWSVIDRWPAHPAFVRAVAARVREGLAGFPEAERDAVTILFSTHSVPLSVVRSGDPYVQEVAATVRAVMDELGGSHPHVLSWQSRVGPIAWQGPSTADVLRELGRRGCHGVLAVAVAFTTDGVETLAEIDQEYAEVAERAGIAAFRRAPAPNDHPLMIEALARVVADHVRAGTEVLN
jgi:ferrochelatase